MNGDVYTVVTTPAAQRKPSKRQDWCARILPALQELYVCAGLDPDPSKDFSEPQYNAITPLQKCWYRPFGNGHLDANPVSIPAGAVPAGGSDAQCDIWTDKGMWSLSGLVQPGGNAYQRALSYLANWFRPGTYDAFAWGASFTPNGQKGNATTFDPVLPLGFVTVRPDEIVSGIHHMIGLAVPDWCSMTGPEAPAMVTDVDDPSIGSIFGASCSPAPGLESRNLRADLSRSVPDGYGFYLNPTKWTDDHIHTVAGGNTITVAILTAMRDYGVLSGCETTGPGGGCFISMDGSPQAKAKWLQMGLTAATQSTILSCLKDLTVDDLIALAPPVSTDTKGNTFTRDGAAASIALV